MREFDVQTESGPARVFAQTEDADEFLAGTWFRVRRDVVLGLDTETNALNPWEPDFRVRMIQVSDGTTAWLLWPTPWCRALLRTHPTFVAHFSEAEVRFLGRDPIMSGAVRMEDSQPHILDTQPILGHYDPATLLPTDDKKIDPRLRHPKGLKETYAREFGPHLKDGEAALHAWFLTHAPKGSRTKKKALAWGFAHIPWDQPEYQHYGALDAIGCKRLYDKMISSQRVRSLLPHVVRDVTVQWDCDRMTYRGLPVVPRYVRWLNSELERVIADNTAGLAAAGIAPSGMGASVGTALADLGVPVLKWTRGSDTSPPKPSWDKDALGMLVDQAPAGHPALQLARTLTKSRQAGKFHVTYVDPMMKALQRDNRVHCSFRAVGTVTHRMSAAQPPLQQQPKKDTRVRAAYGGVPGWVFVSADFNQGEPRTMAALSGDPAYVAAVLSGDVNNAAAAAAFADFNPAEGKVAGTLSYTYRQSAKVGFLAVCYKAGVGTLARAMHMAESAAAAVRNNWHATYRVMFDRAARMDQQEYVTLPSGRSITLWDRRVFYDGRVITSPKPSRKSLNYETQGAQRDYLVDAWMILRPTWQHFLAFFLHDEIVLFVPEWLAEEARADLAAAMTMELGNGVTMECEATIDGPTWLPQPSEFDESELSSVDAVSDDRYA